MTKDQRIAELERQIADLSARLALLEARPQLPSYTPAWPQPYISPYAYPTITYSGNICGGARS